MERPREIIAGDTHQWTVSSGDYPPSASYSLKVTLSNSSFIKQFTATTSGSDFLVTISAADADLILPGTYSVVEAVEKGSGASLERHTLAQYTIVVRPGITASKAAVDGRTNARKMLDAIEETIISNLGKGYNQMAAAAQTIGYRSWEEMLKARSMLKTEVRAEETSEKLRNGAPTGRKILARFL